MNDIEEQRLAQQRATSTLPISHPGKPVKLLYPNCPQCNDHATTLQPSSPSTSDGFVPQYYYCSNCGYREGDQPEKVDAKARHTFCDLTAEESASSIEETYARAVGEVESSDAIPISEFAKRVQKQALQMHGATFDGEKFGKPFEVHQTGAIRSSDADDVRFDLIPQRMLERVAKVMAKGAIKYGEYNWQKGFKWSSIINHLSRHTFLYLIGDTSEDHLAHMVCNLGFLMEYEVSHPELNDIPTRK